MRPDALIVAGHPALHVRPIEPRDRAALAALFDRLGPSSRYRRFLGPKPRLSERELTYLTDVDHVRHEALVAVDPRDGSIAGVGRYTAWAGFEDVAEVAFEVADDLQGRGIGRGLAARIVQRASENGIGRLTATTLAQNRPALALLRRLAFQLRDIGPTLELELDLRSPAPSAARGSR